MPRSGCLAPVKTNLLIKDLHANGSSKGDRLVWKWRKGPALSSAEFGDPRVSSSYTLCIYAGTSTALVGGAYVAPDGDCSDGACWETRGSHGYRYRDPSGSSDGVTGVQLIASPLDGHSKLLLKGTGANLRLPILPLAPSPDVPDVTAQLQPSGGGTCWESVYPSSTIKTNTPEQYKATR